MGSTPVGVQCPMSSSQGEFPAIGIDCGVLGFRPYWCPSPFPSPSILDVFHSLFLPSDFNRVSFLWPTYRHPFVDPSLTHFSGEFPGLGLALAPNVVVPEAEQRCTWSRKLDPNFCPGRARTSDLGIQRPRMLPLDHRA